ncbi:MAG: porin [Gammaproteobacteria bacterium]|nr:porin [Gammaproteobacteria bacterium]MCI0591452.1 porin [Gammaproteobacteria bacterium]
MMRSPKTLLWAFLAAGWAASVSLPALAANEAMLELLEELRDNGTISQEQYEVLRNSALADEEKGKAQVEEATKDLPVVTTKGKFEIASKDGNYKWSFGGRLQVDGAYFDNDRSALLSAAEVRRARVDVQGTVYKVWELKFEYEFTESPPDGIKDAYIKYVGFKPTSITVGNFKEPFSLEEMTSSRFITFMERALPNVFAPSRFLGAGVHTYGETWTAATGFFGNNVQEEAPEGYGIPARVTFAPVHEETRVAHLGANFQWRNTGDDKVVRFRQRPESHVTDVRLVDTGTKAKPNFDASSFTNAGAELAGVYGPWSVQGEYIGTWVHRETPGKSNPYFWGAYLQGSWFLTGESRNYKFTSGAFDNVKPKSNFSWGGGWGAWEAAFRYSYLDLSDQDINGGEQDDITLGLNWYVNPNIRFMWNLIKVLDVRGGPFNEAKPFIAQMRAQVIW